MITEVRWKPIIWEKLVIPFAYTALAILAVAYQCGHWPISVCLDGEEAWYENPEIKATKKAYVLIGWEIFSIECTL